MDNYENLHAIGEENGLTHFHDKFGKSVSVPTAVFITEAEAQILADYFLSLIAKTAFTAGLREQSTQDTYMHPYSIERLQVLVESGFVTERFISNWWGKQIISIDDYRNTPAFWDYVPF